MKITIEVDATTLILLVLNILALSAISSGRPASPDNGRRQL